MIGKINECISNALGLPISAVSALDNDELLTEFGLDSLHFIQLIVILEEAFDIEVLDSDLLMVNFINKANIYDILRKYVDN